MSENKAFCKKCGNSIPVTSKFCPKCGTREPILKEVENDEVSKKVSADTPTDNNRKEGLSNASEKSFPRICNVCASEVVGNERYCKKCGTEINSNYQSNMQEQHAQRSSTNEQHAYRSSMNNYNTSQNNSSGGAGSVFRMIYGGAIIILALISFIMHISSGTVSFGVIVALILAALYGIYVIRGGRWIIY